MMKNEYNFEKISSIQLILNIWLLCIDKCIQSEHLQLKQFISYQFEYLNQCLECSQLKVNKDQLQIIMLKLYKNCRVKSYSYLSIFQIITKISILSKQERKLCKHIQYQTSDNNFTSIICDNEIPHISKIQYILDISKNIKIKINKMQQVFSQAYFFEFFYRLNEQNYFDKVKSIKFMKCKFKKIIEEISEFSNELFIQKKEEMMEKFKLQKYKILFDGILYQGNLELYECEIFDIMFLSIFRNSKNVKFKRTDSDQLQWFGSIFNNLDTINIYGSFQEQYHFLVSLLNKQKQHISKKLNISIEIYHATSYYMHDSIFNTLNRHILENVEITIVFRYSIKYSNLLGFIKSYCSNLRVIFKTPIFQYDDGLQVQERKQNEFSNLIKQIGMKEILDQYNNKKRQFKCKLIEANSGRYDKCLQILNILNNKNHYLYFKTFQLTQVNIDILNR